MQPTALVDTVVQTIIQTSMQTLQGAITVAGGSPIAACRGFSEQAAALAVTAVWQGALIACGLAI
jgi:hypothetical protein